MPGSVLKEVAEEVLRQLDSGNEYIPCYGMDDNSNVAVRRLVVRRERKLLPALLKGRFRYTVKEFDLSDILTAATSGGLQQSAVEWSQSFQVTGKDLGDLTSSKFTVTSASGRATVPGDGLHVGVHGDLQLSNNFHVSLRLERLEGRALSDLLEELPKDWRFRQEHQLWQLIQKQRNSIRLGFVTDVVKTSQAMTVQSRRGLGGGARAFIDKLAEITMNHSQTHRQEIKLPADKVLVYKMQELEVSAKDGSIAVPPGKMASKMQETDVTGAAEEEINPDKEIENCQKFFKEFYGQLSLDKRVMLTNAIMQLLIVGECEPTSSNLSQESIGLDTGQPCSDYVNEVSHRLKALSKEVKAALPTDAEPRTAEICKLMEKLGLPGFLDLPGEGSAVYGIRYFVTALRCLSPSAWQSLVKCFRAGFGLRLVEELDRVVTCAANDDSYHCPEAEIALFLQDAIVDGSSTGSFLHAWRAAYTVAIHMSGLA